ncbi:MAG: 3-keto-5-aminohexanoate cleavage protein [Defluviitaleaceae bacterium]|nr:3-keto-5-aminohexanoate cleavage protein [Defluviitaleaceae bacterium]
MNKVIISVAPVSATPHPINIHALAEEVAECAKAGAAMVHLHVRDQNGYLTDNTSEFNACLDAIRRRSDIVLQGSTGGVSDMDIHQRCAPLYLPLVETCSLNVGSVNLGKAVYVNPIEDVETCVQILKQQNKMPEIEVFELGMIDAARRLDAKLGLPRPMVMNIVVGHEGGAPATANALTAMWQYLAPGDGLWGFTHAHRQDFGLMACALGLGARLVRIGFEDSAYINGRLVSNNVSLVTALVGLIDAMGLEVATAEDARGMLGLL